MQPPSGYCRGALVSGADVGPGLAEGIQKVDDLLQRPPDEAVLVGKVGVGAVLHRRVGQACGTVFVQSLIHLHCC